MSRVSVAVRSIHWGRVLAGVGVVCSSGAVAAVAPQYALPAAVVGGLSARATENANGDGKGGRSVKKLPAGRFAFRIVPPGERTAPDDLYRLTEPWWLGLPWEVEKAGGDELVQIEPWLSPETETMIGCRSRLVAQPGYFWDGPSGPTLDTVDFIRPSCPHDQIYRLIRKGFLPFSPWRARADWMIRQLSAEDGMSWFRRNVDYWGLRLFGGAAARS